MRYACIYIRIESKKERRSVSPPRPRDCMTVRVSWGFLFLALLYTRFQFARLFAVRDRSNLRAHIFCRLYECHCDAFLLMPSCPTYWNNYRRHNYFHRCFMFCFVYQYLNFILRLLKSFEFFMH